MVTHRSTPMCRSLPGYTAKFAVLRHLGRGGMTLMELMFTIGILSFLMVAMFGLMGNARMVFFDISTSTELRNDVRLVLHRIEQELRNSGYNSVNAPQFTIASGGSAAVADSIQFSVPVACSTAPSDTFLDATGKPAHWGASVAWGCTQVSCTDADNSCATVEYKKIRYSLNSASGELIRSVLNQAGEVVVTAVIGRDISNFKVSVNNAGRVLSVAITGSKTSATKRAVVQAASQDIRLMN